MKNNSLHIAGFYLLLVAMAVFFSLSFFSSHSQSASALNQQLTVLENHDYCGHDDSAPIDLPCEDEKNEKEKEESERESKKSSFHANFFFVSRSFSVFSANNKTKPCYGEVPLIYAPAKFLLFETLLI